MSRKRWVLSLAVNAYLFISTLVISLSNLLTKRPPDSHKMGFRGVENLMYFTVDSNILMALCAACLIIFLLKNTKVCRQAECYDPGFRKGIGCPASRPECRLSLPGWFHITVMAAAVSVGVTFATVAFFLSPGQAILGRGYFSLFTGNNLFLHLINPLLGCAVFIWLIPKRKYSIAECLFGIIPTAIYGAVYTVTVAIIRTWPDIYNFTLGGHYELAPIPIITILALAFGIAVLLTRLHNRT